MFIPGGICAALVDTIMQMPGSVIPPLRRRHGRSILEQNQASNLNLIKSFNHSIPALCGQGLVTNKNVCRPRLVRYAGGGTRSRKESNSIFHLEVTAKSQAKE